MLSPVLLLKTLMTKRLQSTCFFIPINITLQMRLVFFYWSRNGKPIVRWGRKVMDLPS
jgi:hypothetical protein